MARGTSPSFGSGEKESSGESRRGGRSKKKTLLWFLGAIALRTALRRARSRGRKRSSNADTTRSEPAEQRNDGGGSTLKRLFAAVGLLAAGYLIRDRMGPVDEKMRERVDEPSSQVGGQTETMTEKAGQTLRERGKTVSDRAEETTTEAAAEMNRAGEELGDTMEETSEELGEQVEESEERTSDRDADGDEAGTGEEEADRGP